ncbi:hypothetical protein LUD75_01775 [Epilithonimonas sp. JDS]|uniref:hypothetical protein n=1 Tax=Epilithonimonas sp. JDS TaxID=2902797 RepID=UPI001E5C69BA|nr:hypothetical protein [Epilithonimonas sp. JDS]MCD9853416.1 hypothetical protein [Epilithonimonas sp. JDS]
MKKTALFIIILLSAIGCSQKNNPEYCSPLKAVELLKNNPQVGLSKTQTGFYEIASEDEKFIYFGYRTLNLKLKPKMNPFYKTDKKKFNSIIQKIYDLDLWKAEAIIENWYLEKYPEFKFDSIQKAQTIEIKFLHNKTTDKYDASCTGWIEFYYSRMEKSTRPNIDSAMTNYTIKKFDYVALITNGKDIERIKSK